jgi:uncharacterized protein (TIGR02001 family)
VTAPAPRPRTREWGASSLHLRGFVTGLCLFAASPAAAEVGAAVSVFSDARFRGYSLSSGHPVGVVDLSYDDPGGLYGAVSASAVASSDDGIRPLGLQLSAGYARRLRNGFTVDLGAVHSRYSHYSSRGYANSYTEIYAGASRGVLTSRVYFSPHYFGHGSKTLYGELDATVSPIRKLRLNGHAGLLVPIDYRGAHTDDRAQYDWRVGVDREIGRASLHAIVSGGGPGRDYYGGRTHRKTALILGLSWAL